MKHSRIFLHIMHFTGNQTVQGSKDSFSANCSKGFKRFQTMNKGLIKLKITKFVFATLLFKLVQEKILECFYQKP